ncbi:MAG TPA: APC family permease [Chloroflexia bacterium]|nr:APC family permease [Chloroflexia bacterium]
MSDQSESPKMPERSERNGQGETPQAQPSHGPRQSFRVGERKTGEATTRTNPTQSNKEIPGAPPSIPHTLPQDVHGVPHVPQAQPQDHGQQLYQGQAKVLKGTRPGDRYVRVVRAQPGDVQRIAPRYVQLTEESLSGSGTFWRRFKRFLIGRPIATARSSHERLNKIRALAVFASDALSSVAYSTEATLYILFTAMLTQHPMDYIVPISIAISILVMLVVNSYRQTVHAYPGGGGSYIVTKDNLGINPGLIAAAAILIDYTLTVAVSVSAGVLAIISAFPSLNGYQVEIGVGVIVLIMIANLRGVRESGTIFAVPTYLFIASFLGLIAWGLIKYFTGNYTPYTQLDPATQEIPGFNTHPEIGIFLILQAFAAGCSALTGVEAISDGVQVFKKPESKNAATTLVAMGALLMTFVLGSAFLAEKFNAMPGEATSKSYETVISELGRAITGDNSVFYYILQFSTSLILVLAANTAFADFPRLSFFLARDKFLPNIFAHRGDRLAYSTGIIVLAVLASILLAVFNGHTDALIPLYAVGVFTAFTLSQTSMVIHWQKEKRKGATGVARSQVFNAIGAFATGVVLVVIILTKFMAGAWLVVILIPLLFMMFKAINRHYTRVQDQLRLPGHVKAPAFVKELPVNGSRSHNIIVPISRINKATLSTLDFARSLGDNVTALFISDEPEAIESITMEWKDYDLNIPLVVLENPFRSILPPLLNYIDTVDSSDPDDILMIVLPEFVAQHWWEHLLHNQTALRIKSALLFRPGIVVVDVPYHMQRMAEARGDAHHIHKQ